MTSSVTTTSVSPLLRLAILKGSQESVQAHLDRGNPINGQDERGLTLLMIAAAAGRHEICLQLLTAGSDITLSDSEGKIAADHSRAKGYLALADALTPTAPSTVQPFDPKPSTDVEIATTDEPASDFVIGEADLENFSVWVAEESDDISGTDLSVQLASADLQCFIASHRMTDGDEVWALDDLILPVAIPRILIPGSVTRLFVRAAADGEISVAQVHQAWPAATPEIFRTLIRVLKLGGLTVRNRADMRLGWTTQASPLPSAADRAFGEELTGLFESLLDPVCGDLSVLSLFAAKNYAGDRDTELRLFGHLHRRRLEFAGALHASPAFLAWLSAGTSTLLRPVSEADGEEDEDVEDVAEPDDDDDAGTDISSWLTQILSQMSPPAASDIANFYLSRCVSLVGKYLISTSDEDPSARLIRSALDQFIRARDSAINAYLNILPRAAQFYATDSVAVEDLVQEGVFGLIKAAERFQPERGVRFITYATFWLRQTMKRVVDDQGRTVRMPVYVGDEYRRIRSFIENYRNDNGCTPHYDDIARGLEFNPDKVRRLAMAPVRRAPMNAIQRREIGDPRALTPAENRAQSSLLRRNITSALLSFRPKDERILRMRFGLGGTEDRTLDEVGRHLGVTRERIRQLEAKSLEKMLLARRRLGLPHIADV